MEQKLILTDADGVLFDWVTGFNKWMETKGFNPVPNSHYHYTIGKWYNISEERASELVTTYNSSAAIGFLPPYLDSVKYVKKLNEIFGYKFVVITAMGQDEYAAKLRRMNLDAVFGDVFEDLIIVDLLASKQKVLERYEPMIWLEDKPSNAEEGRIAGHRTFLFEHGHNGHLSTSSGITRVHNWEEAYKTIVLEEEGILATSSVTGV